MPLVFREGHSSRRQQESRDARWQRPHLSCSLTRPAPLCSVCSRRGRFRLQCDSAGVAQVLGQPWHKMVSCEAQHPTLSSRNRRRSAPPGYSADRAFSKRGRAPRPQLHPSDVFWRRAGKPLNQPRRRNEAAPVLEVHYYPMSGPVVANALACSARAISARPRLLAFVT